MVTGFLAIVSAAAVLAPALSGFGRSRTYAWIGFIALIAGGVLLVATPTPMGFDPGSSSHRWLISTGVGQEVAAALMAAGAAGLLGAFAAGHPEPIEHTEQSRL